MNLTEYTIHKKPKSMTNEQVYEAYLYYQQEMESSDARNHMRDYLENHSMDDDAVEMALDNLEKDDVFRQLAAYYDCRHDCNDADNDAWDCIIRTFVEENGSEYGISMAS